MPRRKHTIKKTYLDFSDESADDIVLKVVEDAVSSAGTLTHQIAVDVAGTTFYLYAYTTGT